MSDRAPGPEPLELGQLIADVREESRALERNGAAFSPERVRAIMDAVWEAAEDYLTFLPEKLAALRCGYSEEYLRSRFPQMERDRHAKLEGRGRSARRLYRACALPRRANTADAAARGREAARALKAAS